LTYGFELRKPGLLRSTPLFAGRQAFSIRSQKHKHWWWI